MISRLGRPGKSGTCIGVALVGLIGCGKTEGARALEEMGFRVVSAGDLIRRLSSEHGVAPTREALQRFGRGLLKTHGEEQFGSFLLREARDAETVVFDGIRPVKSLLFLKRRIRHFLIIYIDADPSIRFARVNSTSRVSPSQFKKWMAEPMESEPAAMKALADVILVNNSDLPGYRQAVREEVSDFLSTLPLSG